MHNVWKKIIGILPNIPKLEIHKYSLITGGFFLGISVTLFIYMIFHPRYGIDKDGKWQRYGIFITLGALAVSGVFYLNYGLS